MSVLAPTILPMELPLNRLLQYLRLHTYVAKLAPTILPMKLPLKDVSTILWTKVCARVSSHNFAYEIATQVVTTVLYTKHSIWVFYLHPFCL